MNIQKMRENLKAQKENSGNTRTQRTTGDNASYPFWNIKVGENAVLRFLPDGDVTNEYFWVERQVIKLPFSGIVGGEYPTSENVTVTVPCIDMFEGMRCPIIAATKHLWNDESTKETARTYWKKKSWIFQGLVVSSPFIEENEPENKVRRFVINKQVYDKIYDALLDPELDDLPTDFDGGLDFTIKKTQKGQWSDYNTSSFARKSRSLTEMERSIIDTNGLFTLKDAKGAVPSQEQIDALPQLLRDSMDGLPFDVASFGALFRAYGANGASSSTKSASDSQADRAAAMATPAATTAETPAAPAAPASDTSDMSAVQDLISRLSQNQSR